MAFLGRSKDPHKALEDALRAGDHEKAISVYEALLRSDPDNQQMRLRYADSLKAAGRKDQAVETYVDVAQEMATTGFLIKAIAVYKKVVALDPSREDLHRELAEMNLARERGADYKPPEVREREEAATAEAAEDAASDETAPEEPPAEEPAAEEPVPAEEADEADSAVESLTEAGPDVAEDRAARRKPPAEGAESPGEEVPAPGQKIPLFSDLSPEEFSRVVLALRHFYYPVGEVIVEEGAPGDSLFVVVDGEVAVSTKGPSGKEVELARLTDGDFFGEVALMTGKPRTATITAVTETELMELTREDFEKIAEAHPSIRETVKRFWQERTDKTVETMVAALQDGA